MNTRAPAFTPDFRVQTTGEPSLEEYGRFQQHLVLLEDYGRISAFRAAIESVPAGDVVVDVGAGTGVLGLLALAHGFRRAILVEPSRKMATYARHFAAINGFEDRVTVIESRLEDIDLSALPAGIDLIVTETISSLLFGFGSWDALPRLAERLRDRRNIVPARGQLLIAPASRPLPTRLCERDGFTLIEEAGLRLDLLDHAFRSGGNVNDKALVAHGLASGELRGVELASFDFQSERPIAVEDGVVFHPPAEGAVGAVLYWTIDLSAHGSAAPFTNLDPRVTSWYPYYLGFTRPITSPAHVKLRLVRCDAPYTYAFQLTADDEPLTQVLYW